MKSPNKWARSGELHSCSDKEPKADALSVVPKATAMTKGRFWNAKMHCFTLCKRLRTWILGGMT